MTPTDRYAATARFLKRFYGSGENETLGHIAALQALGPDRSQRILLALEMRDLLNDREMSPRALADFASAATGRFFDGAADAREFLRSVFEMNLFDTLAEAESLPTEDPDA